MWVEPLFWGWVPRPVGMVPALSPLSRVPGLCAVGLGLRGGRQVVEGEGPQGFRGLAGAWDCVNPRPLALFPWAEQVMGLEPVRASWMKQAWDNTYVRTRFSCGLHNFLAGTLSKSPTSA